MYVYIVKFGIFPVHIVLRCLSSLFNKLRMLYLLFVWKRLFNKLFCIVYLYIV